MNNDRVLSAMSMARGAGKLKIGFEAAREAVYAGASMVIMADDVSERTSREVGRFCEGRCELAVPGLTQDDIERKFGRRFGVAAVTDDNFAELIRKAIQGRIK